MKRGSLVKMLSKHDDDLFNQYTFDQDPFAHFGIRQPSKFENNSPCKFSRIPSMNAATPFVPSQSKQPSFLKQESIPTSNISLFKPVTLIPTEMK